MNDAILESRLWKQPRICLNILLHPVQQEADTLLSNPRVFAHTIDGTVTSYCVLMQRKGYLHLMDVFTFPTHRGMGYCKKLLYEVLADTDQETYLTCRDNLESFYEKMGFQKAEQMPAYMQKRVFLINCISKILPKRPSIVMCKQP